jgi:hypothetical protein
MADVNEVVAFTSMAEGTREDYELLERLEARFAAQTADRVLEMLRGLAGSLAGYQVDRLEYSFPGLDGAFGRLHRQSEPQFEGSCVFPVRWA